MPKFQGKTGEVLKVTLPSAILSANWGQNEVANGGKITLEVLTHWVSDGSDIKITIKDIQGGTIEVFAGKIYGNYFRTLYTVAKPNNTGGMSFEAELKAHGLKALGPRVRVDPYIKIKDLKWLDDKGQKELQSIKDGTIVTCQAKVEGAPLGGKANVEVLVRLANKQENLVFSGQTKIDQGQVQFQWQKPFPKDVAEIKVQADLDKMGGHYFPPEYFFSTEILGVKALSAPLAINQHLMLTYEFSPGVAGKFEGKKITVTAPDGSVKDYSIPADGKIEVPKTLLGEYLIDDSAVQDLL